MASGKSTVELSGDDPIAFKLLLDHCYGLTAAGTDHYYNEDRNASSDDFVNQCQSQSLLKNYELLTMDVVLNLYKLSDKYLMDPLKKLCVIKISELIDANNYKKVIDLAFTFNYVDLQELCTEYTVNLLLQDTNNEMWELLVDHSQSILTGILEMGSSIINRKHKEQITKLCFYKSWECSGPVLDDETVFLILKSDLSIRLNSFTGCFSAKVVNKIIWLMSNSPPDIFHLWVSLSNDHQAQEVTQALQNIDKTISVRINLLIKCNYVSPKSLLILPERLNNFKISLSNVTDKNFDWVVEVVSSLSSNFKGNISFPHSRITFEGYNILSKKLKNVGLEKSRIEIDSPYLSEFDIP